MLIEKDKERMIFVNLFDIFTFISLTEGYVRIGFVYSFRYHNPI